MKIKLRTDIPAEDLFLLKIKYGSDEVSVESIHESDYKYFEKLGFVMTNYYISLITEQMVDLLDFDSFNGDTWRELLRRVPEFSKYCKWSKLASWQWVRLLEERPQFSEYCDWESFQGHNWCFLLIEQPQFAEFCEWDKLNGRDWENLLRKQPQFAEVCNWSKLRDEHWERILEKQPQIAKYRK